MQKLLLLSIIVANVAIPIWASRDGGARKGLRKALIAMLIFNVVYVGALLLIYPRL